MRIVILVDLLRLQAHDEPDGSAYAFGVSFAPSVYVDPGDPAVPGIFTDDLNAGSVAQARATLAQRAGPLVPWCWSGLSVQVFKSDGTALTTGTDVTPISLPPSRDLSPPDLDTIEQNIVSYCVQRSKESTADWNPLTVPLPSQGPPPANAFSYPAFVQSAAGWPAPVPHGRFNFVMFFRVKASSLPDPNSSIVAIPTFSVGANSYQAATTTPPLRPPPPTPPAPYAPLPNNAQNDFVDYYYATSGNLGAIGNVLVQTRCAKCSLKLPDSSASFVDLPSLWVRAQNPLSGAPALSKDAWFEELPKRLERAFDLPNRLIDALSQPDPQPPPGSANPPSTSRQDLRKALLDQGNAPLLATKLVLRALHDCLGPVWTFSLGPPRAPASFSPVTQQLVGLLIDSSTAIKSGKEDLLDALQQYLGDLLQNERVPSQWQDSPNQPWTSNPWIGRLANRLSKISDFPADPGKFVNVLTDSMVVDATHPDVRFQLDRLASVVALATSPQVLTDLTLDTWSAAAATPLQALTLLVDMRLTFSQRGLILMRARRGVLQPAWSAPDGLFQRPPPGQDKADLDLLRDNTAKALASYGLGTLAQEQTPAPPPPATLEYGYAANFVRTELLTAAGRAALQTALTSEALSALGSDLSDLSPTAVLGISEDDAPPQGIVTPGGVTIQFDRVVRGPQTTASGSTDDDFHQYLAGYGILANLVNPANAAAAQWRGLTVVNIGIGDPSGGPLPAPLNGADGARIECVTPLTPTYDDEALPAAAVHYDNAPIVATANVVRRADVTPPVSGTGQPVSDTTPSSIVVPLQPRPGFAGETASPMARLPFLAFGVGIQSASFVVTNHGALPRELADPSFPALLAPAFAGPPAWAVAPGPTSPGAPPYALYLRRVAVGPLGMPEVISGYNAFSIDPDVRLLTDELLPSGQPSTPAINFQNPGQRPMPRAVLLAGMVDRKNQPANNQTQFAIRAPSVDIEVFDRWIAFDEFIAAGNSARQQQIRDYRKALRDAFDRNSADNPKQKNNDKYSIGDPAVSLFYVRATRIFADGGEVDVATTPVYADWSLPLDGPNGLLAKTPVTPESTHRLAMPITIQVVDASTPSGLSNTNGIKLGVDEGEVWVADVFAGIDMALVNTRIDSVLIGPNAVKERIDGKDYWLVSQFTFTVEGATRAMLKVEDVYAAFAPGCLLSNGNITFAWQRGPGKAAAAVGAVNVGWQQWRQTGRPASPFPYGAIANLDEFPPAGQVASPLSYPMLWEVEAFAERPNSPSQGRRFEPRLIPAQPGQMQILASEAPSPPPPARYLRFEVSAESRYARLYDNPPLKPVAGSITNGKWSNPWKRVFRPAMPTAVHPLNVKAVVPLTRSVSDGDRSSLSGVLMVIDGAFGESGGIAENIEVRAVYIVRQLQGNAQPVSATEFGADPILRAKPFGQASIPPDFGADLRVTGPIGHTFDIGALAPAFQSTSFIVEPPDAARQDFGAGWMVKLRARRVLDPRGVTGYGAITFQVSPSAGPAASPVSVPLSGNGDLSLAFVNLPLVPGGTLTIALTGDRTGGAPPGPPGAATTFPQSWNLALSTAPDGTHATTVGFGGVTVAVPGTLAAVRLLVVTRRLQRDNLPVDRFEATLDAITADGTIVRAGEISFEDAPATGAVHLSVSTSGTASNIPLKVLRAPLASDWVETGWTQFLPDTKVQMRDRFNVGPSTLTFAVQATGIQVNATPKSSGGAPSVAWCTFDGLASRKQKDDQGLVHFLLLTRDVPSFGGANEAYVGLYILKSGLESGTTALFTPFGTYASAPAAKDAQSLRARIMVVQVDPRNWQTDPATWIQSADRPWDAFFPPETTTGVQLADANIPDALISPQDANLRILTVYAPFRAK